MHRASTGDTFTHGDDPLNPDQPCSSARLTAHTMKHKKHKQIKAEGFNATLQFFIIYICILCRKHANCMHIRGRVQCSHCVHSQELLMVHRTAPNGNMKNKLMCASSCDPLWNIPLQITKRDSSFGI